ncbi:MAG: amylosucrase [Yoonia sp.]|jgi:amylosucrase
MKRLIETRRKPPALAGNAITNFATKNPHVLGYVRSDNRQDVYVLSNFADDAQVVAADQFLQTAPRLKDLITDDSFHVRASVILAVHQIVWLA